MSSTDTASVRPTRDARPVLLFFVLLTIAALLSQTWWAIEQDRQLAIESEKRHNLASVRALEEHAIRILEQVDHVISEASESIQELKEAPLSDPATIRKILNREKIGLQSLASVWITDLKGVPLVVTDPKPGRWIDFQTHRHTLLLNADPGGKKVVIGLPIKQDGEWLIPIASNLFDAKGRRIGIIGASIRLTYFGDFYSRVTAGTKATVTLRTGDGFVMYRSPFEERALGQDLSKTTVTEKISRGSLEGSFEDISIFGNKRRLFTYRTNTVFPVTTIYALDMDSVLAVWRSRSIDRAMFTGLTIVLIGVLSFFLMVYIKRKSDSERSLAISESRYRTLYESANDPILLLTRDQIYVDCNTAALKLFGVSSKEDIIGKSAGDFSPPEQASIPSTRPDRQRLIDAALAGVPQQFEWATLRHGQVHYNELTLSRTDVGSEPLVFCIFRDIDARKEADELQAGQNRILHIIANGMELQRILKEIILFIEKHAPHGRCMILLLNEDRTRFVWGAGPNIPEDLMRTLTGAEVREGNGICSEVVMTQYPVIVENIGNQPSMRDVREVYAKNNFVACGSWPIMGKSGQILGAFTMLYDQPRTPTAQDVQLVGISTDLAGIAIEGRWAEDRIRHLAHYDELTGLPNRFLYIQHLNKAIAHAERHQLQLGVLFLDMDRFKTINDTFGHDAGDKVLRDISLNFKSCLRECDTIAHVGGDEFIVLVDTYTDPRHLGEIAQRLLAEATRPFEIDGQECQLSASIGIATYPIDGANEQALLKNADIAMYRAKTTGKNNYQFYSSEMNTHTVERLALEIRLRRAIDRREFVVYYQPRVDVQTGAIVGAEALVRWQHPEQGLLFPGSFIAVAEEAGLIGRIGMLVLENTCRDVAAFQEAGLTLGRVAINLSGSQFNDANLLYTLKNMVQSGRANPAALEFEITESTVMHNRDQAVALMDDIRDLGFTLSIDDFGTGYSSLAYLKRFPVDSVKIDKSFINDIPDDPNDSAIVRAIIVMAHTLGLKVTAEGVETATQLETLDRFGCDEYQGFYFSKAVSAKDFMSLAQRQAGAVKGQAHGS